MLDLNNGDVMIKFGSDYAHFYRKSHIQQIKEDINSFESDSDTTSWDNNEIEYWVQYSSKCPEISYSDLLTEGKEDFLETIKSWLLDNEEYRDLIIDKIYETENSICADAHDFETEYLLQEIDGNIRISYVSNR